MMADATYLKEPSVSVKFDFKLRKTVAETHQMLKHAFCGAATGHVHHTCQWLRHFKKKSTWIEDDERS